MDQDFIFTRVAAQFFGVPLLLRQPEAEVIGNYLRSRMIGAGPDANRFQGRDEYDPATRRWKGYRKVGSVGVVSIIGELVGRGAWMGASSGLTSYEGIIQQVRNAAEDRDVRAIILDIDSPGGAAFGMADAARQIRKIAAGTRLVASINSMAASAAYGLASAADEIVVGESGVAGSVGVLLVHLDRSRQFDRAGITTNIIKTGDEKALANPYQPLSDDDRATLEAEINRVMDGFIRVVTDHRPKLTAKAIRDLQAGIRIGEDAVKAGLADRVGTFESVLAELSRSNPPLEPQRRVTAEEARNDRFHAIFRDPRLAGRPGIRDLALESNKREPPHVTADEIIKRWLMHLKS
jgi:signal peptide peptidase SppA